MYYLWKNTLGPLLHQSESLHPEKCPGTLNPLYTQHRGKESLSSRTDSQNLYVSWTLTLDYSSCSIQDSHDPHALDFCLLPLGLYSKPLDIWCFCAVCLQSRILLLQFIKVIERLQSWLLLIFQICLCGLAAFHGSYSIPSSSFSSTIVLSTLHSRLLPLNNL